MSRFSAAFTSASRLRGLFPYPAGLFKKTYTFPLGIRLVLEELGDSEKDIGDAEGKRLCHRIEAFFKVCSDFMKHIPCHCAFRGRILFGDNLANRSETESSVVFQRADKGVKVRVKSLGILRRPCGRCFPIAEAGEVFPVEFSLSQNSLKSAIFGWL